MKVKKWFVLSIVGVISALFLTGCSIKTPLPSEMDKEKVIAAGEEIRDMLFDGKYEQVANLFREDIRKEAEITAEKIAEMMQTYANPEDVGKFKKINKKSVAGSDEDIQQGIVVFECEFSKKKVGVGISFDLDMNLMGIVMGCE